MIDKFYCWICKKIIHPTDSTTFEFNKKFHTHCLKMRTATCTNYQDYKKKALGE